MVILGLTGSIGMGKTTAAKAFKALGVPVHDSDKAVHQLMAPGGAAYAAVLEQFPGVEKNGVIDRQALGTIVYSDDSKLKQLENILHPLVRQEKQAFLAAAARRGEKLVVLDIPLLLETGGDESCDGVVVVSAPARIQRYRVMGRPGMTEDKFSTILGHQMDDAEKRQRADFIVQTGLDKSHGLRQVADIVKVTSSWRGRHWPPAKNPGYGRKNHA